MIKQKWFGIFFLAVLGSGIAFWGFEVYKKKNLELKQKKMINNLSAKEYKELIADKKVWNLDVREEFEYKSGHIKDSLLAPATNFYEVFNKLGIKREDKIALYCRSGNRSWVLAKELVAKGYENIYNLELGINEWKQEGFKVKVIPIR